jgi:periplasmic protein TonB
MCKIIDIKKILFILLCLSMQPIAFGQNSTDSAKILNSAMELMDEDIIYTLVDEMPDFPGGDSARMKFLSENFKYPEFEGDIQGVVYVEFIVEKNGSLTNIKVKRAIGGGYDEECVRVVKLMPKWKQGKQRGEYVRTQFILPFKFILN